jgi:hypothetical protein
MDGRWGKKTRKYSPGNSSFVCSKLKNTSAYYSEMLYFTYTQITPQKKYNKNGKELERYKHSCSRLYCFLLLIYSTYFLKNRFTLKKGSKAIILILKNSSPQITCLSQVKNISHIAVL